MYMLGDHIDGYLMEDARTHDANFGPLRDDGSAKATMHDGLSKTEGFPIDGQPGAFDDMDELVSFVVNASPAAFVAELATRIDHRDYEDWWIFVTAISAGDSGSKNSYHYHDPGAGVWRYVPACSTSRRSDQGCARATC